MTTNWKKEPNFHLPKNYRHWLCEALRLSYHFERQGAKMSLKIIKLGPRALREHESQALQITSNDKKGFGREVILVNEKNGEALSHAHVCVSLEDQESIALLKTLGTRMIGENVLHHDADIARSDFWYGIAEKQDACHVLPTEACKDDTFAFEPWSRYSTFSRDGKPWLVITETLAPSLSFCEI